MDTFHLGNDLAESLISAVVRTNTAAHRTTVDNELMIDNHYCIYTQQTHTHTHIYNARK